MRRLALLLLLVPACAPHYRTETLGSGTAGGAGVEISTAGAHTVTWAVSTPRALKLHWAIACGGATMEGEAGETFADYQTRRLDELRTEKKQEQSAVSSLVGAVGVGAGVRTPDGQADAEVHADGDAVAAAVISDDVALPAGDLGASVYRGTTTLDATAPGACTMTVSPVDAAEDAAGVIAEFQVTRTIDLDFERRQERARQRDGAIEVRGALTASLVELGADPDYQRKRAAEVEASLRVKVELDAQAQAELDARARAEDAARQATIEVRVSGAIEVRDRLRAQLIAMGADPDYQARLVAQRDAELRVRADTEARAQAELDAQLRAEASVREDAAWRAREAREEAEERRRQEMMVRFQAALDVRVRLTASLLALGADPDFQRKRAAQIEADLRIRADADNAQLRAELEARDRADAERTRRYQGALAVRGELLAYLEGLGAFAVPPMPEPLYEDQGESPGAGSVWIAGEWVLVQGREWQWMAGGWSIPTSVASDTTVSNDPAVETDATTDAGVSVGVTVHVPVIVIEHRDDPPPPRPKTRDHRK